MTKEIRRLFRKGVLYKSEMAAIGGRWFEGAIQNRARELYPDEHLDIL